MMLICSTVLLGLSSCVIPWYPSDPHSEVKESVESGYARRESLINTIGPPDFLLDKSSFIWIDSKIDAYFTLGYNLSGPVSDREFILAVDFDSSGTVIQHETHSDSGIEDFCFNNGICFTPTTLHVPLAPVSWDAKAKNFESNPTACVVYLYRDTVGAYDPSKDYAHINVSTESKYDSHEKLTYLEHASVASVPGGFSLWKLPAPVSVRVQVLHDYPFSYGFGIENRADRQRPWDEMAFDCEVGDVKYVRLFIPASLKHSTELNLVSSDQAKDAIGELSLVLRLGWGGFFGKVEPESNTELSN
jgi:hypothetical protein